MGRKHLEFSYSELSDVLLRQDPEEEEDEEEEDDDEDDNDDEEEDDGYSARAFSVREGSFSMTFATPRKGRVSQKSQSSGCVTRRTSTRRSSAVLSPRTPITLHWSPSWSMTSPATN
jgi:hypothetical protein